ncbi:PREDICTED: uncharacterized protein LOC106744157 [Dinoponera quadriceps]|uniref:Odorant receptor n=1 Tax=Dinoponera quadriceps TaxID=609295 RepID=A0A6P3X6X4_DINQU|nr:PREDICTED: uncharacterized protein LOC106744157 [Dinoponera quadriceps]
MLSIVKRGDTRSCRTRLSHISHSRDVHLNYRLGLQSIALRRRCNISMKTMETTFTVPWTYYYGIVQKLSLITGMWPYLKPTTRLLRVTLLTLIVSTVFIPQIAHQFTCKQELQCIFESMTSCLLTSVAMVKVWGFQLNIHKIKDFTEHLYVDWKELETLREYEIMKSYAENCRRFSLFYPVYCFSAVYVFMSVSIVPPVLDIILPFNESRPILLPYPGYYFVDSKKYFLYIFGHSLVSWEVIMAGLVAHDCMFVSYVEHVCSMFAVIGFARLLENTFTVPFVIQLLIIIITMSCTLLQVFIRYKIFPKYARTKYKISLLFVFEITQQEAGVLEVIRYVLYVIGQLFHLFCLSFEGQKLIDHSLWIRDKIASLKRYRYDSLWYEAPLKSQKLLILTMIQSLRPASLSAGKIYVFSLESFTTVLQTSMSYFTVLSSFQ